MLMAAGLGTRLRPFTDQEPKALLPLLGVPMAQFAVDALAAAGVSKIVMNIHHHAQRARAGIEDLDNRGARIVVSDESGQLLGSAGGIRKALPHFWNQGANGAFYLVNADILTNVDLSALARHHQLMKSRHGALITLALLPGVPNAAYREIGFDPSSFLVTRLGEVVPAKPYFAGVAVIEPEAVASIPEGPSEFVPNILAPAVEARRACAFPVDCLWRDIGSPALWLETHFSLMEGLETGNLPPLIRKRLEAKNRRLAQGLWVSCATDHPIDTSRWNSPCYWAPLGESGVTPPRELGPFAALYGPSPDSAAGGVFAHGIGFGGLSVTSGKPF